MEELEAFARKFLGRDLRKLRASERARINQMRERHQQAFIESGKTRYPPLMERLIQKIAMLDWQRMELRGSDPAIRNYARKTLREMSRWTLTERPDNDKR